MLEYGGVSNVVNDIRGIVEPADKGGGLLGPPAPGSGCPPSSYWPVLAIIMF